MPGSMSRLDDLFVDVALPELPEVDGLISPQEQRYLYWLTSTQFEGRGRVVEIGTWFGRSTLALGAGLRDAGHAGEMTSFDKFEWKSTFDAFDLMADVDLPDGGDFMPYMVANIESTLPGHDVRKADVADIEWTDGPIEILFVDAPKNYQDFSACIRAFGGSVAPDALLVLQDFFYSPGYPIAMLTMMLGDRVEMVHTVSEASTASFVVRGELTTEATEYWRTPIPELIERWREFVARFPQAQQSMLDPCMAFHLLDRGDAEAARNYFSTIEFSDVGQRRWEFLRGLPAIRRKIDRFA